MTLSKLETDRISEVVDEYTSFLGQEHLVTVFDHVLNEDESKTLLGSHSLAMSNQDDEQLRRYMPAEAKFKNFFRSIFESYTFYRGHGKNRFAQYLTFEDLWHDIQHSLRKETRLWVYIEESKLLFDGNYDCCLIAYRFKDSSDTIFSSIVERAEHEGIYFLFSKSW